MIDPSGSFVIPAECDWIGDFTNGTIACTGLDGIGRVIDRDRRVIWQSP